MAQQPRRTMNPAPDDFASMQDPMLEQMQGNLPAVMPRAQGDTAINIWGGVITAQRVAVARNHAGIKQRMLALAQAAGEAYYYRIPFKRKNKETGEFTTEWVEGESIDLANDLAREWGNCGVEVRVFDEGPFWVFYARFVDYETGYNLTRAFQQRKAQNTGMKDQDRALDIVFQIGQSKAIRNVVVNALKSMSQFAFKEAKKGLRARVEKEPEAARTWIATLAREAGVDMRTIERTRGLPLVKMGPGELTATIAELRSIIDGVATADEIYGAPEESVQHEAKGGDSNAAPGPEKVPPGPDVAQPAAQPEQQAPQAETKPVASETKAPAKETPKAPQPQPQAQRRRALFDE